MRDVRQESITVTGATQKSIVWYSWQHFSNLGSDASMQKFRSLAYIWNFGWSWTYFGAFRPHGDMILYQKTAPTVQFCIFLQILVDPYINFRPCQALHLSPSACTLRKETWKAGAHWVEVFENWSCRVYIQSQQDLRLCVDCRSRVQYSVQRIGY